jgi:hypothetical protein
VSDDLTEKEPHMNMAAVLMHILHRMQTQQRKGSRRDMGSAGGEKGEGIRYR